MCELLALSTSHPTQLSFSLHTLAAHGGEGSSTRDGWCVAFYQGRDVALFREPTAAGNSPLVEFLETRGPPTTLAMSHIRHATRGSVSFANTQPFVRELGGYGDEPSSHWLEVVPRRHLAEGATITVGVTAGYGHVVPLQRDIPPALRMVWHTQVGAIAAPFVPVFMGMRQVPEEYRQHRYLTTGESSRFMDMRHAHLGKPASLSVVPQGVESTRSAVEVFKRLMNLVLQHADVFLPEVIAVWEAVERRLVAAHPGMVQTASTLVAAGREDLALDYIDYYCSAELRSALECVAMDRPPAPGRQAPRQERPSAAGSGRGGGRRAKWPAAPSLT